MIVSEMNTRLVAIALALNLPLFVASASFFKGGTGVAVAIATVIVLGGRWKSRPETLMMNQKNDIAQNKKESYPRALVMGRYANLEPWIIYIHVYHYITVSCLIHLVTVSIHIYL